MQSDFKQSKPNKIKNIDAKVLITKWALLGMFAILLGLFAHHALADENLYQKNYKAQSTYDLKSMQANPDTKLYVSNHKDEDNISMLENGYDMMGSSGFEAGDVPPQMALTHAKDINADVVLVYSKFGAAKDASAKIALIKEAAKTGRALTEKDVADEPTQYKYYASYWAKMPTPLFGVHVIKLVPVSPNADEASIKQASKGLKILAVIKDSPAAKAGLMRGDVLLNLAGVEVDFPEILSKQVGAHQGETVNVAYAREGKTIETKATINQR